MSQQSTIQNSGLEARNRMFGAKNLSETMRFTVEKKSFGIELENEGGKVKWYQRRNAGVMFLRLGSETKV